MKDLNEFIKEYTKLDKKTSKFYSVLRVTTVLFIISLPMGIIQEIPLAAKALGAAFFTFVGGLTYTYTSLIWETVKKHSEMKLDILKMDKNQRTKILGENYSKANLRYKLEKQFLSISTNIYGIYGLRQVTGIVGIIMLIAGIAIAVNYGFQ